ncbi:MAG: MBL fold metallo-hydrolase [Myxococcales bacterium]|nr:MBL fold metallo-hydrolase [Myxococcales bacterium]
MTAENGMGALVPIDEALARLGLADAVRVIPVDSGYPSPKKINLVLTRRWRGNYLYESSAATESIVRQIEEGLDANGVERLEGLLVTHCHGDHAGSAGIIAGRGRPAGERAPIYCHSTGYRYLAHPEVTFLDETYLLFLHRAHWGRFDYSQMTADVLEQFPIRKMFATYFRRTPKHALRFVDHGELPAAITAVHTPGHSLDCVVYYDEAFGLAVPGDTIITTGTPDDASTWGFVVPIFTVLGQSYSAGFESFILTIRRLRRFFEIHDVRVIIPPHGKFAILDPHAWVKFAEGYFESIYRALLDELTDGGPRRDPFVATDVLGRISSAGAHKMSTPSHVFGMLCSLAEEGFFDMEEDEKTRHVRFTMREVPPEDFMARKLAQDPGFVPVYSRGGRVAASL